MLTYPTIAFELDALREPNGDEAIFSVNNSSVIAVEGEKPFVRG
jgi:hypothetical protein